MELTLTEIQQELDEKGRDLDVFLRARELIRQRVLEVKDSQSKLTPLINWSGTDAVLGSLDLAIHAMERTVEELNSLKSKMAAEQPKLRLITNEQED